MFCRQQLDTWMRQNPDSTRYVAELSGDQLVPVSVTMTWSGNTKWGLDPDDTGGHRIRRISHRYL